MCSSKSQIWSFNSLSKAIYVTDNIQEIIQNVKPMSSILLLLSLLLVVVVVVIIVVVAVLVVVSSSFYFLISFGFTSYLSDT